MSKVILQYVSYYGDIEKHTGEWNEELHAKLLQRIEKLLDTDKRVFIIIDEYSEYKDREEKR